MTPARDTPGLGLALRLARRELRESIPEARVEELVLRRVAAPNRHRVARVPGALMADAAKASAAGTDVCIEHFADSGTEFQVRCADNAGRDATWPVQPGGAHR